MLHTTDLTIFTCYKGENKGKEEYSNDISLHDFVVNIISSVVL